MINKAKIDAYISHYVKNLPNKDLGQIELMDDCLFNFNQEWDLGYLDFGSMFTKSFKSNINTRLWKKDNFYPLEVMKEFINYEKEILRSLFRDLMDETKSIDGRVQRFVFYCDQLIQELIAKGKKYPEHYHGNYYMPMLYLTFSYPSTYWMYDLKLLKNVLFKLGDKDIPVTDDIIRYNKILKLLNTLLWKDHNFQEWHDSISDKLKYQDPTMMWGHDLMSFINNVNPSH